MESIKNNPQESFELLLQQSFGWLYQYDDTLENYIIAYKKSSWNKKEVIKDQILHRFLENKNWKIETQYFSQMYKFFLEVIDSKQSFINHIDISDLDIKLFREIENKKKLLFILNNTDISESIIIKSQKLSNKNPYHNFWHQLWTTESAIRIAQAQWLSRKDINLLALVWLFHDASHEWITRVNDEEIAHEKMMELLSDEEIHQLWCVKEDIKKLILATKFSFRGKFDWILEKIIQDADLWWIWYGPYYMLYSTMWIIEEEWFSISDYINKEKEFISYLEEIDINIFLSDWARKIFIDPRESLKKISQWPQKVIDYAYNQRYQNISFDEFKKNIDYLINNHQ